MIILEYMVGTEQHGWQLLQMLKMHHPTADVPILVCTSAVREVREMESYLLSKSVGLLFKPFEVDDLIETVRNKLEMRRQLVSQLVKDAAPEEPKGTAIEVAC